MPAGPVNAAAQAKAQQAWSLRVAGLPWARIAEHVGYSDDAGAIRAVRTYAGSLPEVDRHASRQVWRERIEWLWARAARDVQEQRPGAVRAAVALAQRAGQLDGLDVPAVSVAVTPTLEEFERFLSGAKTTLGLHQVPEGDPFQDTGDTAVAAVSDADGSA